MKKVFFILMLMLAIASMQGQSQAILAKINTNHNSEPQLAPSSNVWQENFNASGTNLPTGWLSTPTPGGNGWTKGDKCVQISYNTSNLNHDAWLFSKTTALEAGKTYMISWWVSAYSTKSLESMEVKIGTAQNAAGMSTELWKSTSINYTDWKMCMGIFTPAASGEYYIGFHAISDGAKAGLLTLDDVAVGEARNNDLSVSAPVYPFARVPVHQTVLPYQATVRNIGKNAQTNVKVTVKLNGVEDGVSATIASLASGAEQTVNITPTAGKLKTRENTIEYIVSQTQTDDDNDDNTSTLTFTGTNRAGMYEDDGLFTADAVTWMMPTSYFDAKENNFSNVVWGNIYTLTKTAGLISISSVFAAGSAQGYRNVIYKVNEDGSLSSSPIYTSQPLNRPSAAQTYTNDFANPFTLEAGSYFVGVTDEGIGGLNISYEISNEGKKLYMRQSNGEMLSAPGSFLIRMRLIPVHDLEIEETDFNYTMIPTHQHIKSLAVRVKNEGIETQTNVTFSAKLDGEAIGSSSPISVEQEKSDTMSIALEQADYVSISEGEHVLTYTLNSDQSSQYTGKTTETVRFKGTADVFAMDDPDATSFSQISSMNGYTYGNIYDISDSITLWQITARFGATSNALTAGQCLVFMAPVLGNDSLNTNAILINNKKIEKGAAEGWYSYNLDDPMRLAPGKYFVGIRINSGEAVNIQFDKSGKNYYYRNNNRTKLSRNTGGAFCIRLSTIDRSNVDLLEILEPATGVNLSATSNVKVKVKNNLPIELKNIPIHLTINGNLVATENLPNIAANTELEYSFTQKADLSAVGKYVLKVYTTNGTDTLEKEVRCFNSATQGDAVVEAITAPGNGILDQEDVTVKVKNEGLGDIVNVPISLVVDNNLVVTDIITKIEVGQSVSHTFSLKGDFSAEGNHTIKVYTALANDALLSNDTLVKTVLNADVAIALSGATTMNIDMASDSIPMTLNVRNDGGVAVNNLPITMLVNNNPPVTEIIAHIGSGEQVTYTFAQVAAFVNGKNTIKMFVQHQDGDNNAANDTVRGSFDCRDSVVVERFQGPSVLGYDMGMETVSIALQSYSTFRKRNVPVELYVDGVKIATEYIPNVKAYIFDQEAQIGYPDESRTIFTFQTKADLSADGEHQIRVKIALEGNLTGESTEKTRIVVNHVMVGLPTPYFEGFEGITNPDSLNLPANWINILGYAGYGWATIQNGITPDITAHSGNRTMFTDYYGANPSNPLAISEGVRLEAGKTYNISFWYKAPGYFNPETQQQEYDRFRVYFIYKTPTYAYVHMNEDRVILRHEGTMQTPEWTLVSKVVTPTETGNYYLGFRQTSDYINGNVILIDDISIKEAVNNDLVLSVPPFPYTQVPVSQKISGTVATTVSNSGVLAQPNVKVSATLNGTSAGQSTAIATLNSGAASTLNVTFNAITASLGTNTIVYTASSDSANQGTNNTASSTFAGTEDVFAVDEVTSADGIVGLGNTQPISVGNIFEITETTNISGAIIGFTNDADLDYSISLHKVTGATTYNTTALFTHNAKRSEMGLVTVPVPQTELTPGKYLLVVNQLGTDNIGLLHDNVPSRTAYILSNGTIYPTSGYGAVTIRMIIGEETGVQELNSISEVSIYPNPTSDKLFFNISEEVKCKEIYDLQGKLVKIDNSSSHEISVQSLPGGAYILKITTDSGLSTLRFVKK